MSGRKAAKHEDGSDEVEMNLQDKEEEINVDFEGFNLCDQDYSGIKQLLTQLFTTSCELNLSKLSDALISQNFIGTVLKQGEISPVDDGSHNGMDVDDVFALVTCYSLTRPKDEVCDALYKYLAKKCEDSKCSKETKDLFNEILESGRDDRSTNCLGLIFNERFINIPPQASLPMFFKMLDEISEARNKNHQSHFDFTHFILISKTYNITMELGVNNSIKPNIADDLYQNAEEEIFAEHSIASFDFNLQCDDVTKKRRVLSLNRDGLEKAISNLEKHLKT